MTEPTKDNTFCFYPFYALVFKLYENQDLKAVAPCCMMHDTWKPNICLLYTSDAADE